MSDFIFQKLCPENVCVPVMYFICSDSTVKEDYHKHNCKNVSNNNILFGLKNGVCFGVVKRLRYCKFIKSATHNHVVTFVK